MVLWTLEHALGGELFVPKIPSYRITDVAEAIGPSCEKPITGIRPGEKLHEQMIGAEDSYFTYEYPENLKIVLLEHGEMKAKGRYDELVHGNAQFRIMPGSG